jgi:polyisoprenoid-binding protein YceI
MNRRAVVGCCMALALSTWAGVADAQSRTFKVNYTSRATFRTDAPLETIVGTTAGEGAVTGNVVLDPVRPQEATGTVRVDLNAIKTGIDRRDIAMRRKDFLDSEANEANRWAVFEVKGVEIAEQVESQKRFGLTAESLRVTAKFPTSFTNHGMQVPQLLILKLSNDIQIETDLVLVLAQ